MRSKVRWFHPAFLIVVTALMCEGSGAAELAPLLDLQKCTVSPAGSIEQLPTEGAIQVRIRSGVPTAAVRLVLRKPVSLTGKERFVLDGRSREFTGLALCLSRLQLIGSGGGEGAAYEPDLLLPPEWNQRTVLLSEFEGSRPSAVRAVVISLWNPYDVGREYSLFLRRCEFQSREEVAAALLPPAAAPRRPLRPQELPVAPGYRRWTSFGPGGGGWYRTVAISPHDGTCFVGADVGGIYRSRDNCRTWRIVNTGIPNLYINAIAFHPTDPNIVFAGCNGGVLRSDDGGTTWTLKRNGFPPLMTFGQSAPVSSIAVDPADPRIVFAGIGHERNYGALDRTTTGGRVYRSTDGGETWRMTELPGGEASRKLSVLCIRFDPHDHRHLYLSTQRGLFASRDGGESWAPLGSGLDGYETTFLAVKQDASNVLLLAYRTGPEGRGGVLRSEDGGETWTPRNTGLLAKPGAWRLVADPHDANTYYVGWHQQYGLYVTHDCGDTWAPVNTADNIYSAWFFVGANVTGFDIDPRNPNRLVYCNDMDLYQTLDAGKSWDQVATNLVRPSTDDHPAVWRGRGCEVLCAGGPQALAVDPTNPKTLYFGYWDTHAWKSDDGGQTCYRLTNGISSGYGRMGCVVLDPADPDIVYLSKGENYDHQRIYKSVNAGREFVLVGDEATGLPPGGIFSMVIAPSSPPARRVLYATVTGYGVYKSEDGGLTWHAQSNGLPTDSRMAKQIVIDPRNPQHLFLVCGADYNKAAKRRVAGYIARTTDGGGHWEVMKSGVEAQCVLIDPFDSQKVYVGNRNFSGIDYPNAFYKSTDGGTTWTSFDQKPFLQGPGSHDGDQGTRVYVSCLAADPLTPGKLYAGCTEESYDIDNGRGVFVSTDWGDTWRPFVCDGLANYRIGTLIVDPTDPSRLYVGTGGDGFFRFGPPAE